MKRLLLAILLCGTAYSQPYDKERRVGILYVTEIRFDSAAAGGHLIPGVRPRFSRESGVLVAYDKSGNKKTLDSMATGEGAPFDTTSMHNQFEAWSVVTAGKADASALANYALTSALNNYALTTTVNLALSGKQNSLGFTPENVANRGAVNGYASLGVDGKVPSAQLPAAGSDPWTYVRLSVDFPTSSATAVDVGLAFTPQANTRYEIEGKFLLRTATATVGPRPGVAWPTGMTDGTVTLRTTSSATAFLTANGNINAAVLTAVGGLPNNTQSYPGYLEAMLVAGASPGSTFRVQLASETAGTTVTMKAGSFIKYRLIP